MHSSSKEDQPRAFATGLEALFNRFSAFLTKAANSRLTLISPVVTDHGHDYERCNFMVKVCAGTITIDRVKPLLSIFVQGSPIPGIKGQSFWDILICDRWSVDNLTY